MTPLLLAAAVVSCSSLEYRTSDADAEGRFQVELRIPNQPWVGVTGERSESYCVGLPAGQRITKVRTFFGVDRGNVVEAAIDVVVNGYGLVSRSEHKETEGIYDAWKSETVSYVVARDTDRMMVYFRGWSTAQGKPANMHFGVIVEFGPR